MIVRRRIVIFCINVGITSILLLTILASADTVDDETGDVEYSEWFDGIPSYIQDVNDKPNIDITEISYEISGGKITLSLQVVGVIEDAVEQAYWVQLISEEARYFLSYSNGDGIGSGESYVTDDVSFENVTVSENTISCNFDWYGDEDYPTGQLDFSGQAGFDILEGNDVVAVYLDTVIHYEGEDDEQEYDEEGEEDELDEDSNGGNQGGTPGFEIIVLCIALGIALTIWRRRKIN